MHWPRLILIVLLTGLVAGCGVLGITSRGKPKPATSRNESLKQMDPARIQADTMGFADRFVTSMTGVCDQLERRASTQAAKDTAHQLKTDLAIGAISDAVNPNPIAGLFDMVVLVTLMRQIAEDPRTAQTFGPNAARLVQALRQQEADVRSMAKRYLTDAQLAELDELASRWHRAHPDERFVSHVHLADLPEANQPPEQGGKLPSSVFALLFFDPTANLDPAVREIQLSRATSERMFFYLQRLPLLLQLQAESFYRQFLVSAQLGHALQDVSAVASSTTRFVETSSRFTAVAERFPQQLTQERREALAQLSAEVTKQREAAITQATTRIASERQAAIAQAAAALREEQQTFVSGLETATQHSIDRLLWRLAALGVLLIAAATGAAVVYRRVTRH